MKIYEHCTYLSLSLPYNNKLEGIRGGVGVSVGGVQVSNRESVGVVYSGSLYSP